jgi:GxxExxY protein
MSVIYKGALVGNYFADIIFIGKVLLELKSVKQLDKSYEAQILNYLKATGLSIGLLVNFTYPKAVIKRFVS